MDLSRLEVKVGETDFTPVHQFERIVTSPVTRQFNPI